ncbi:MAG: ion transporter [Acidiferrobacterales bacterium]|nr:ion transporter [Acidiferrobacterales bacterium]
MTLRQVVEESDTRAGRAFDLIIQFLIVVSLITFCIETLPDLTPRTLRVLNAVELFTVAIFTLEYLLRLYVAEHKARFIFSFYGLVDLLAVLPFYIASGVDLRSIRVLRLFRLFRIFKLFRYSKAIRRFRRAFGVVREELVIFLMACLFLIFIASVGIYYFERSAQPEEFKSIFHSMWWAVATLTTVGYGDVYPVTAGGRIFTFLILMIGLGIIAVPTGLIASAMQQTLEQERGQG